MKLILFTLFISSSWLLFAQGNPSEFHKKVNEFVFSDPELAAVYALKELKSSKPMTNDHIIAQIDIAKCEYYADNYDIGEKLLLKALEDAEKLKFKEGIAWSSFHLGDLRLLEGRYGTAIQNLNRSYDLFKNLNIAEGEGLTLNAIGLICLNQDDFQKAQEYFLKALTTGDAITHGDSYSNLANLYLSMEAYPKAKHYAKLALKQSKENDDYYVRSIGLDVLGSVAMSEGNFGQAELFARESIQLKESLQDQKGASTSYLFLAELMQRTKQNELAYKYMLKSYLLADAVGANQEIRDASYVLSKYHARKGHYDSAFFFQNRFIDLNESLMNEQVQKKIAQIETEKSKRISALKIADLEHQKKLDQKTTSFYLLLGIGGFVILLGALYLFYYRYKVKKRSFDTLEIKNKVIEEQNQHILESIRYAQRIQEAILPNNETLVSAFNTIFTIYMPKDIVAGDFYWFEEVETHKIIACCDSTGHGVPGAMVSVVCSNALHSAVNELGLTDPGQILDATRSKVIENFNKSKSQLQNVRDGMDISLLSIDKNTGEIRFAGAHHTALVYRNKKQDFDQYKGDKQPIGIYEGYKNYQTQLIEVDKGDRIFMFSDGYADQFGGKDLKKLKNANVRKYLSEIQTQDLATQHDQLTSFFNTWKGEQEQVDDVTVIALEV